MPQTNSAKKALKQSKKRTLGNTRVKKNYRKAVKLTEEAIRAKKGDFAALLRQSQKAMDKAAKKGVIKKGRASRKLSRLAKAAARVASEAKKA